MDGVLGHIHLEVRCVEVAVDIGLADVLQVKLREAGLGVDVAFDYALAVDIVQENCGDGVHPCADVAVQCEGGIVPQDVPGVAGGVELGAGNVHQEFVHGGVDAGHIVRDDVGVQRHPAFAANSLDVNIGLRNKQVGVYGRQLGIRIGTLRMGCEGNNGIGVHLLEGGDVFPVLLHYFADGALVDAGVQVHVDALIVLHQVAGCGEQQGRNPGGEGADIGLEGVVAPLRQGDVPVQMDGYPHPAEVVRTEGGRCVCVQLEAAPVGVGVKVVKGQGQGVGREAAGHKEGIHVKGGVGPPKVRRTHPAVQLDALEAGHKMQRVHGVGEHYERPVGEADSVNLYVCSLTASGIFRSRFSHREDVPVCSGGIKVMGKYPGALQLQRMYVDLVFQERHVIERCVQPFYRRQGVDSGSVPCIAGLHQAEAVRGGIDGVKTGIALVGVGDGKVLGLDARVGETPHDGCTDLAELHVALHELRGILVHQTCEDRRSQQNLKCYNED